MRKFFIFSLSMVVSSLLLGSTSPAKAVVFGFEDGQFYNIEGTLEVLCFMDKSCYNLKAERVYPDGEGNFTTTSPTQSVESPVEATPTQTPTPVITQPTNPAVIPQPTSITPVQSPTSTVANGKVMVVNPVGFYPTDSLLTVSVGKNEETGKGYVIFQRNGRIESWSNMEHTVEFNGQEVIDETGTNGIAFTLYDGSTFEEGSRSWIQFDNLELGTLYSYTYTTPGFITTFTFRTPF